eukprot:Selendium_serpulae@DN5014_c0_g1_i1.p1
MKPIDVAIVGALGRMGQGLCNLAATDEAFRLVGAITASTDTAVGKKLTDVLPDTLHWVSGKDVHVSGSVRTLEVCQPHVVIDFSSAEGTVESVSLCSKLCIPLVIGTTGLKPNEEAAVEQASTRIPLIHAMNYSLGVNVLVGLCKKATQALGTDFDIEIVEAHHNKKADAPSGTAFALADGILETRGMSRSNLVNGRSGKPGPRSKSEVGMHAMRMGSIVGDHHVHFTSEFESIEISHRALDRKLFVKGALMAGKYLVENRRNLPGRITMQQVLFGDA